MPFCKQSFHFSFYKSYKLKNTNDWVIIVRSKYSKQEGDNVMVWGIEIEGDEAVFEERRGATRGTNYFYIESNGELSPVRLLGQERFMEEFAGNVREYRVRVDLGRIRGNVVYHFAFSKKGFFFSPRLYRIENGEIREIGSLNREEMKDLKFTILGEERNLAEPFERMGENIREIMKRERL